nr:hypothetical protein [Tanacetum cinerariifolium]
CSQPEDSNESFQKLLEDLKELAEYDKSINKDRPIFLNDNEDHPVQNKESPENSSEETVVSNPNQEPPQDSDIHQLIEECSIKVCEEQKQNMEKTMLDLVKICHHKQFLCIITPETESDEVTESNAKTLLPIPSECEVTSEDKRECDELVCENPSSIDVCDNHSEILFDSNNDDLSSDDKSFEDIEYIIMVNLIPPDHVDDVPVVELNQYDDVLVVPKLVLVDEDKDLEEEEFKDEEDPQEEEDDMEVDIKEDENEPELTYNYEEMNPINPLPPASELEPEDAIEVENLIEHEDETIPASVHEKGKAKDGFYVKLIFDLGNEVRSSVKQGTAAMENLVEKLSNAEGKVECKKLKKELKQARFSNTFLRMQNERVERDIYWTRVRAHDFYQEMIRSGFVFKERPNEAIDVLIKDEEIMTPKSAHMTQARQMIKENVDDERARHANVGNDDRGSGPVRGQDAAPAARECTFDGFMNECVDGKKVRFAVVTLQGPALTWWNSKTATMGLKIVNRIPWAEIKQLMTRFNELAVMCPRMVEPERVKVDAYIQGLNDIIKGEVTSSKPANLSEAVRMVLIAHY